ncbi:MAG: tetratricopeptide repeat protein [Gemmatimonadales bacterium]
MRLMFLGVVVACCAVMPAQAQQTATRPGARDSAQHAAQPTGVVLPPEPTEHVGSGDSAARAARALVYVARGEAATRAGMRDSARIAYEKALDEDYRCSDAVVDLARMMVEDGDGLHAQGLLMTALRRDPTNPKLLHFSARRIGAPPDSSTP